MKLLAKEIIDPDLAFHYAYAKTIRVHPQPHDHDFYEFFITFEDGIEHLVNGERQVLPNYSLVFIRPRDKHCFEKAGMQTIHLLNVAFFAETMEAMCAYLEHPPFISHLLALDSPPVISLDKAEQQWIKARFEDLAFSSEIDKSLLKHRFKVQLIHLFIEFFQRYSASDHSIMPLWLSELSEQMQQKQHFLAGLPRLLELSQRSQEHVNRSIKRYFGMTTTAWLNQFKLRHATHLLLYTDMDILELAFDSGFENLSHFYQVFKRHYKQSPAKYRKTNKKVIV